MRPIAYGLTVVLFDLIFGMRSGVAGCLEDMDIATAAATATAAAGPVTTPFKAGTFVNCLKEQITQLKSLQNEVTMLKNDVITLKRALYDDVDEVYTISNPFSIDSIKNAGPNKPLSFSHYIYANPEKHNVVVYFARRQNNFNFKLCVNGQSPGSCDLEKNDVAGLDLTEKLKAHPLRPTNAGVDAAMLTFPDNVQLIELLPMNLNWDSGDFASIDGYIIVRRAIPGEAK
jgi:hypothetical protein